MKTTKKVLAIVLEMMILGTISAIGANAGNFGLVTDFLGNHLSSCECFDCCYDRMIAAQKAYYEAQLRATINGDLAYASTVTTQPVVANTRVVATAVLTPAPVAVAAVPASALTLLR